MARWAVTLLALVGSTLGPQLPKPVPSAPCEPPAATSSKSVADLLTAARCYDDRWAFADAERVLAASIAAIETPRSAQDEIVPSGPVFVGATVASPGLSKPVVGEYPAAAAARGIAGIVIVGVTLKADGSVRKAEIVESIPELDSAALDTVKKMRFEKTLVTGQPIEVSFFVPARFGLAADQTPADVMTLAQSYLAHQHPAAAVQALKVALELEHKDLVRFGKPAALPNGRQGGYYISGIKPPERTHNEPPKYPPEAMKARVQGTVIVESLIDLEGRVGRARVLRSVPGLDAAALDAVMKWTYTPTIYEGKPVSIVLTVTVSFAVK